jgi:uncharacterized protein YkwD
MPTFWRTMACGATLVAVSSALLLTVGGTAPASAATRPEHKMFRLVNGDRRSHGIRTLRTSAVITKLARRHSRRMANQGTLFHDCITCIMQRRGWSAIGENVGYGGTVRQINRLFMHSPPHRANILSTRYRRVGIGIVRARGLLWVTEIFFRR